MAHRLATIETAGHLRTIRVESFDGTHGTGTVLADGDLGGFLQDVTLSASADAEESIEFSARQLAPVIPNPRKVLCTGLNFREHIVEMGHPVPDHPTLFAKFATALTTPYGNVRVPRAMAQKLDYEGELAIVMGHGGQIAGYAVMNDFSQRDWQYRTQQWLQGKNLDESSALGPWLTMATDEKGQPFDPVAEGAMLRTWVNGELRQEHSLADLVFKPQELVEYVESFATLEAGDVIALGTPAGVGHGMTPPRYLGHGDTVEVEIEGLGRISSTIDVR